MKDVTNRTDRGDASYELPHAGTPASGSIAQVRGPNVVAIALFNHSPRIAAKRTRPQNTASPLLIRPSHAIPPACERSAGNHPDISGVSVFTQTCAFDCFRTKNWI
jgi:hypothetical protein